MEEDLVTLWQENSRLLATIKEQTENIKNHLHEDGVVPRSQSIDTSPRELIELHQKITDLNLRCQDLQQENVELAQTLQLIMSKYRSQTQQMQSEKNQIKENLEKLLAEERQISDGLREENLLLQERVHQMMHVLRQAVATDSDELENQTLVESLMKENEGLKQMLAIATADLPN